MDQLDVREAKHHAKALSSLLSSLANATDQLDRYNSERAYEYWRDVKSDVFDKWTDLQLAMEKLDL